MKLDLLQNTKEACLSKQMEASVTCHKCKNQFKINHFNGLLKILLLALSYFYLVSNLVQAETWIDINTEEKYGFLQYDIDSLIQNGSNQIDLTWRTGTNLNMPYFMEHGSINCQLI
ncbi:MAG: hypothetical protein DID91_2727704394 [Candidatus Nitrotoga sp. MKT]|nr:MAG: hypothetical protein DID91_2727704394 [Candidatus Nitrotoga sp. MKT]